MIIDRELKASVISCISNNNNYEPLNIIKYAMSAKHGAHLPTAYCDQQKLNHNLFV